MFREAVFLLVEGLVQIDADLVQVRKLGLHCVQQGLCQVAANFRRPFGLGPEFTDADDDLGADVLPSDVVDEIDEQVALLEPELLDAPRRSDEVLFQFIELGVVGASGDTHHKNMWHMNASFHTS